MKLTDNHRLSFLHDVFIIPQLTEAEERLAKFIDQSKNADTTHLFNDIHFKTFLNGSDFYVRKKFQVLRPRVRDETFYNQS